MRITWNNMDIKEVQCPFCDGWDCVLMDDNLMKCYDCESIFEEQDDLPPEKQRRTKPRKKIEENLGDGI